MLAELSAENFAVIQYMLELSFSSAALHETW
jgi:hypothetical protein